jgi:hypothetical protein
MTGHNDDLIQYRLKRSFETLEDARILANAERWNAMSTASIMLVSMP